MQHARNLKGQVNGSWRRCAPGVRSARDWRDHASAQHVGEPLWRPPAPKGFSDESGPWLDGLAQRLDIANRVDFSPTQTRDRSLRKRSRRLPPRKPRRRSRARKADHRPWRSC